MTIVASLVAAHLVMVMMVVVMKVMLVTVMVMVMMMGPCEQQASLAACPFVVWSVDVKTARKYL